MKILKRINEYVIEQIHRVTTHDICNYRESMYASL